MNANIQQKKEPTKREKLIDDFFCFAIDCVALYATDYFIFDEEESFNKEIDFIINNDQVGYITFDIFSICRYKARIPYDYYEPDDYDEYDVFYEDIHVKIVDQFGKELINLSEAVNDKLFKNKHRQLY